MTTNQILEPGLYFFEGTQDAPISFNFLGKNADTATFLVLHYQPFFKASPSFRCVALGFRVRTCILSRMGLAK